MKRYRSLIFIVIVIVLSGAMGWQGYLLGQSCGGEYCGATTPCPGNMAANCGTHHTKSTCSGGGSIAQGGTWLQCAGPGTQTCNQTGANSCAYTPTFCFWTNGACQEETDDDSGTPSQDWDYNEQNCSTN